MTTESPRPAPSPRVPGLRAAVLVTVALGVVAAAGALVLGGRPQVWGALAGAGLVAGFFLFGTLSTSVVAAYAPRAALLVALLTYTLQVALLAVVLVALTRSGVAGDGLDVGWLAGTIIAGTLAWTTTLVIESTGEVRG